jgi:ribonuclease HI
LPEVAIYTDGACTNNPGPGGYGVVLLRDGVEKELAGGFRRTTNNRMEITACVEGLQALKKPCAVTLFSDSRYVVDTMEKGWAKRWKANGWKRNNTDKALNSDLWERMLSLCEKHAVAFNWVKGHAGNEYNERCDRLAVEAASKPNLPPDEPYERCEREVETGSKDDSGSGESSSGNSRAADCPECGAPMVLRKGKFGKFYGCSRFPECKGVCSAK